MDDCKDKSFDTVIFCAPPSGFDDYPGAVEHAASTLWSGLENGGSFVFTSSGGMYVLGFQYHCGQASCIYADLLTFQKIF
jgi:hypothetical protein